MTGGQVVVVFEAADGAHKAVRFDGVAEVTVEQYRALFQRTEGGVTIINMTRVLYLTVSTEATESAAALH